MAIILRRWIGGADTGQPVRLVLGGFWSNFWPMTVFAVVGLTNLDRLAAAVARSYPTESLRVSPTHWLVVDRGTSKEVSEKLGISSGQSGDAMVLGISSYWGRAPNPVWEWLQSRWSG